MTFENIFESVFERNQLTAYITDRNMELFQKLMDLMLETNRHMNITAITEVEKIIPLHFADCVKIAEKIPENATMADIGCGGGFPSVPLAIMFPETKFISADSIGKKITVVKGVCEGAGIKNIDARNVRVEQIGEKFDYIVSRAVTEMPTFVKWIWSKIERGQRGTLPNGILYLKGGDLTEELAATRMQWQQYNISDFFEEDFFETKKVVYTAK